VTLGTWGPEQAANAEAHRRAAPLDCQAANAIIEQLARGAVPAAMVDGVYVCLLCAVESRRGDRFLASPASHAETCAWRLARLMFRL
jgi:hypothetical protein